MCSFWPLVLKILLLSNFSLIPKTKRTFKSLAAIFSVPILVACGGPQVPEKFDITDDWIDEISSLVPDNTEKEKKKLLVISLATGYKHWVIPHYETLISEIGKKNGFSVRVTNDLSVLESDSLNQYDAVALNNTCPMKKKMHLVYDALPNDLDSTKRWQEAKRLENNLIDYVHAGGGLVVLHGGLTTFNFSETFSQMTGASFDYHPKQQKYQLSVIDPSHVITADLPADFDFFGEPYFLNGAFPSRNFKALLTMNTSGLSDLREESPDNDSHPVAWVKKYGFGRVFVSAPTHNAQNFTKEGFIPFITKGINYATGALKANDSATPTYNPDWEKTELLFEDSGVEDWRQNWFLDGTKAFLKNTDEGMLFEAGPEWKNDTSHAVLWTKNSFDGNISIEYDFTRIDSSGNGVIILYFHATGKGEKGYPEDIYDWRDQRKVPTMSTYFRNMNAYHISYSTSRNIDDDYVRLRRYEHQYRLAGTEILPDNFNTGLFEYGVTYHIEISRYNERIEMSVTNNSDLTDSKHFEWDASSKPLCNVGRIGLRHMYTRGARYKNFEVWRIE